MKKIILNSIMILTKREEREKERINCMIKVVIKDFMYTYKTK